MDRDKLHREVLRTFDNAHGRAAEDRELALGSPILAVLGTRDALVRARTALVNTASANADRISASAAARPWSSQ